MYMHNLLHIEREKACKARKRSAGRSSRRNDGITVSVLPMCPIQRQWRHMALLTSWHTFIDIRVPSAQLVRPHV